MPKKILAFAFASGLFVAAAVPMFGIVGTASAVPEGKVTICHKTESETNPWVVITISENAWSDPGHMHHHDGQDFIVEPGMSCPPGGEEE